MNQKSDPGVKLHNIGDVELEDLVGAKGLTKGTLWSVQAIYTNADSKVGLILWIFSGYFLIYFSINSTASFI